MKFKITNTTTGLISIVKAIDASKKAEKASADVAEMATSLGDISYNIDSLSYVVNPAAGEGFADAIQRVYNEVPEGATVRIPAGTHVLNKGLVFDRQVNVNAQGALLIYNGNDGIAIQVGHEDYNINEIKIDSIQVRQTIDWDSGGIGIRVVNVYTSEFFAVSSTGFARGIVIEGVNGKGNSYNKFFIGRLFNNKESLVVTSSLGGWSNENIFHGGRFGWTSDRTSTEGCTHILVEYIDYSNNNNKFYGCSLENSSTDKSGYAIKEYEGRYNVYRDLRYEGSNKVYISDESRFTTIEGGYGLGLQNIEGNVSNVIAYDGVKFHKTKPFEIRNSNSSSDKALIILNASRDERFSITGNGDIHTEGHGRFKAGIKIGGGGDMGIFRGAGSPEGRVTADAGSLYLNTQGGANETLWVKESGTGSTGWASK